MKDYERPYRDRPAAEPVKKSDKSPIAIACAALLLVSGCAVVGWVVIHIAATANGEALPGLVTTIIPSPQAGPAITIGGESIELSNDIFKIAGFGLLFLMLTLAALIGSTLIKSGVALLRSDNRKLITELAAELRRR